MDETPKDYGAPVYLKGSHKNTGLRTRVVGRAVTAAVEKRQNAGKKMKCVQILENAGLKR